MTNQEYKNQAWLTNWLKLKAKQEEKDFYLTRLYCKVVIENYPDLTQLNLSNNKLKEIIIHNCLNLKLVQIAHNKLTKLKIKNCPSVQEIYTYNN